MPKQALSTLYHWRKLNEFKGWKQARVAEWLQVNRITVHRFERYRRRPDEETRDLMASLPNYPLSADEIRVEFAQNVPKRTR